MVAPDMADAFGGERERLALWGQRLGLPKTVRIMETIGRSARDMNQSVDATIVLEVNLARLTHPELDDGVAALAERVSVLERKSSTTPAAAPAAPLAKVGASRRPASDTPVTPRPAVVTPEPVAPVESRAVAPTPTPTPPAANVSLADIRAILAAGNLAVSKVALADLAGATAVELRGDVLVLAVRSEAVKKNLLTSAAGIAGALRLKTGVHLSLEVIVDPAAAPVLAEAPIIDTSQITVVHGADEDEVFADGAVTLEGTSVTESSILDQFPGATELA
jgi:hypothetical protein